MNGKTFLILSIVVIAANISFAQGSCASPDGPFIGFDGSSPNYATANANGWCYNNLTAGQTYCWTYNYPATGLFKVMVIINSSCGNCDGSFSLTVPSGCSGGCSSVGVIGCGQVQYNASCAIQQSGGIEHGGAGSCTPAQVCNSNFTMCITVPGGCATMDVCPMVYCAAGPGNCAGFIPVKLIRLGAVTENEDVIIKWSTTTEINNDCFTIEQSTDGINWNKIGIIKGAGNSSSVLNYEFIDESVYSTNKSIDLATVYYRLIQTDYDGTKEIFGPISVNKNPEAGIKIYPTVSDGIFYLSSEGDFPSAEISVFDVLGKNILTKHTSSDWVEESVDLANVSEGVYTVQVKSGSDIYLKKVIVF